MHGWNWYSLLMLSICHHRVSGNWMKIINFPNAMKINIVILSVKWFYCLPIYLLPETTSRLQMWANAVFLLWVEDQPLYRLCYYISTTIIKHTFLISCPVCFSIVRHILQFYGNDVFQTQNNFHLIKIRLCFHKGTLILKVVRVKKETKEADKIRCR